MRKVYKERNLEFEETLINFFVDNLTCLTIIEDKRRTGRKKLTRLAIIEMIGGLKSYASSICTSNNREGIYSGNNMIKDLITRAVDRMILKSQSLENKGGIELWYGPGTTNGKDLVKLYDALEDENRTPFEFLEGAKKAYIKFNLDILKTEDSLCEEYLKDYPFASIRYCVEVVKR